MQFNETTPHVLTARRPSPRQRNLFTRALRLETLESRQLMAADLTGTVYEDLNRDGVRNNGENGVPGWTVFLDANKDGAHSTGEVSTVTNKDGDYTFNSVAAGNVRVAQVMQTGWVATSPESRDLIIPSSGNIKADFFAFSGGNIAGSVWNDLSQDGVRASDGTGGFTEPGLASWTVYLDMNNNNAFDATEPNTLTDSNGNYLFTDLPPGDYEVSEVLPDGWDVSPTFDIRQTATVMARSTVTQDFANFSTTNGSIEGIAYNDLNVNGMRDVDPTTGEFVEPGLEGWTIFLDTNNNRAIDTGEQSVVTDATGRYVFISLPSGDYEVTELLPDGWDVSPLNDSRQTVAVNGGEVSTASDFGNFTVLNGSVIGTIWNDVNRNGTRDFDAVTGATLDPALAGWSVFLDLNRNNAYDTGEPQTTSDASGNYQFLDLQVGEYTVFEVVPASWETSIGFDNSYTVRVVSGAVTTAHDFANYDASGGGTSTVQGTIWNDLNSNGIFEASETGLSGWTVFIDSNLDGALTTGEPQFTTGSDGIFNFGNLNSGTINLVVAGTVGWRGTTAVSNSRTVTLRAGQNATGLNFGETRLLDASISGAVYIDKNNSSTRDAGDRGLSGIVVYLDANNNGSFDAGEPQTTTSTDLFYTPGVDEAGDYSFTHLGSGNYVVRAILPDTLSTTPAVELTHNISITPAEDRTSVNTKAVYRANEIHGVKFEDSNGNHVRDASELGIPGVTIFVDLNRNNSPDAGEPQTTTGSDGSYSFTGLSAGAYVLREITAPGYTQTAPNTVGGILWPTGTSNAAVGNVSPDHITQSLTTGESYRTTVSITLPNTGALTDLVDVFLLFDDTGSFTNNSPIVRAAFPDIIAQLQSSLPGIDLGFGVGRMEEYANFAYEYSTGRPFVLNQPVVAASSAGYLNAIQAALNRTTPGYGGDQPETDIEALFQLVTGKGFDGNNNGNVSDSGPAGLASTQLNPGNSGDVPAFASFQSDTAGGVMPAAGNVGGAGFRTGALPIVLLATDTGFAYQPKGETSISGVSGVSIPLTQLTETSRASTPYNSGAGIQETVTALNALGALVIGLGTNTEANLDPRQQLEGLSTLTGAINRSSTTIDNGTTDRIAPGDPLYFQIASGFGASVASGIVNAISNAVRNVAVNIDVIASDPRVHIINHSGIINNVIGGQTAAFDIEFIGDGAPHRFDLQFVRAGTNVILGSIPVVLGTPVPGDHYEFDELDDGEIEVDDDFGSQTSVAALPNQPPSFVSGANISLTEDAGSQSFAGWATAISAGPTSESGQVVDFLVSHSNAALFATSPSVTPNGQLTFTTADNAFGTAVVTVQLHDNGGTANGGVDTSATQTFTISVAAVNDAPVAQDDNSATNEDTLLISAPATVLSNDSDIDGPTLTALLVTPPQHAQITFRADGTFNYRPAANFNGADYFTYKVSDGTLDSPTATVHITVNAINDTPVAVADTYAATSGVTLTIAAPGVSANDTDIDGDTLTSTIVSAPTHGSLSLLPSGAFIYTSTTGYAGTDTFTYMANDGVLNSLPATVTIQVQAVVAGTTKFFVVDGSARKTFGYDAGGAATTQTNLNKENVGPRGIATSKDSSTSWVVDKDGVVYVYTPTGALLGSWKTYGIDKPEGITTDDTNLWIVDRETKRVFYFAGAATRRSGQIEATSSFALSSRNQNPMDIVADGTHLWVINDTGSDQVFRYSTSGVLQGNWNLDARNTSPTGLTIDPNNINHIWVVDSGTDSVYQYDSAVVRTSGRQNASTVFALASGNGYAQGISDPLARPTWNNFSMPDDVNNDGRVTPLDALTIINRLNAQKSPELPEREVGNPFWDVNDDGYVSAFDALQIINHLNGSSQSFSAHDAALAAWFDDDQDNDDLFENELEHSLSPAMK